MDQSSITIVTRQQILDTVDTGAGLQAGGIASHPRIIYSSRTHSQIAQVVKELKQTEFNGEVTVAVLGSREQSCVHPEVTRARFTPVQILWCCC